MIQLAKKHRLLLSALSGILMVLSFPYTGSLTPVVFISWIPLLLVEDYISRKKYRSRKVFTHALITFLIYNVGATWWVWNASPVGSIMAFVANTLIMSLVFQLFHLTKKFVGTKEGYISLLIYWLSFEYLHYHWEASWTWLTFGNAFSVTPSWVQWYEYSGVLGGSLWVLIINLLIVRVYQNVLYKGESWRVQTPIIWLAGIAFIVPMTISLITYFSYEEEQRPADIVVVQPNIDPYNEKFVASMEGQIEKMVDLASTKTDSTTDLILFPETALSYAFYEEDIKQYPFFNKLIQSKVALHNIPMCIGASTRRVFENKHSRASFKFKDGPGYYENYNTSMLVSESNEAYFIHKSKLVPGVEAIPFSNSLPFLEDLSIDLEGTTGTLGIEPHPKNFRTKQFTFAPVVCYESIYGGWVAEQCKRGAEVICIATNDGWWGDTPGYKQHMSFARLRAIETRRYVARSANTGTSAFINQRGDVLQSTEWWVPAALKQTVQLNNKATFYMTYGDVLGRSFSFVSALLLLFTFVKRFKKKYGK